MDLKYLTRCQKQLNEWDAPLDNWYCIGLIDMENDNNHCELCGCKKVRFIHIMEHNLYFMPVHVGCICAGIMEGDILAAKNRDRKMKNRASRRKNFIKKVWVSNRFGGYSMKHKGEYLNIYPSKYYEGTFGVGVRGNYEWKYKGKPIKDLLTASYAAFDLIDPIDTIME